MANTTKLLSAGTAYTDLVLIHYIESSSALFAAAAAAAKAGAKLAHFTKAREFAVVAKAFHAGKLSAYVMEEVLIVLGIEAWIGLWNRVRIISPGEALL